jgi:hypothetical protein
MELFQGNVSRDPEAQRAGVARICVARISLA